LLKKIGKTWDDLTIAHAKLKDLDLPVINSFVRLGVEIERLPKGAEKDDAATLLENLKLIDENEHLKNAALLLFGKDPLKYFISATFKIGRFVTDDDLRFQDVIEGNIFEMADKVIATLKNKYLVSPISYEGLRRLEKLEYPEAALREAILNAIVHKDYTDSTIQLSVYNDKLILWNPGKLPIDISIDSLKRKHPSRPRNQHIADIFFKAGYIEAWGRGIEKILTACRAAGLPEPLFEENSGGVQVTFLKNEVIQEEQPLTYDENSLQKLGLNERQIKAISYIKEKERITNREYQELFNISRGTAFRDLAGLIKAGIFESSGSKGAGSYFTLK